MTLPSVVFGLLAAIFFLLSSFELATSNDQDSLVAFAWIAGFFGFMTLCCWTVKSPDPASVLACGMMTVIIIGMLIYAKLRPVALNNGF